MTIFSTDSFVLESYGYNLTRLAHAWSFSPLKGYEAVVSRIFDVLLRKEGTKLPYNPLLIDGDDTRRWRVVLEVLRCLAVGDAPDPLPSLQVIAPSFATLCGVSPAVVRQDVTGAASEGEERLAQLLLWPSLDARYASEALLARFEAFFPPHVRQGIRCFFCSMISIGSLEGSRCLMQSM